MPQDPRLTRLAYLTGHLRPPGAAGSVNLNRELLTQLSRVDPSTVVARTYSFELADAFSAEALSPDVRGQLTSILERPDRPGRPEATASVRVFRREQPLLSPDILGSAPSWGRGAQVSETIGPLVGPDGRRFWFDLYKIIKLVPVYFGNATEPAMLVKLTLGGPQRPPTIRMQLDAGSVWINARLFDNQAPQGGYVGLRIKGGSLQGTGVLLIGDALRIQGNNGNLRVALQLDPPDVPPSTTKAGVDARHSKVDLPDNFAFQLQGGQLTAQQLGAAAWNVYGQEREFSWPGDAADYVQALNRILLPLKTEEDQLMLNDVQSAFFQPAGQATVAKAGWALPIAMIDVTQPGEAAGVGGLAVQMKTGLTANWQGLIDGPVQLASPWLVADPGQLTWLEGAAENIYAEQRYDLWPSEDGLQQSYLEVKYTSAFTFIYVAQAGGTEILATQVSAEIFSDRPVKVNGRPLKIKTRQSLLIRSYSDTQQLIALYDDNILFDNYNPNDPSTLPKPIAIAIAIRNALFTSTPVNGCFLFGELAPDEERVVKGNLLLSLGLYYFIPTLPDPYAADLGIFRRQLEGGGRPTPGAAAPKPTLLLIAQVQWEPIDEETNKIDTRFLFAPLPEGGFNAPLGGAGIFGSGGQPTTGTPTRPGSGGVGTTSAAGGRGKLDKIWDDYFDVLTTEQFALLDVSTNADLMGVSFGLINDETHLFMTTHQVEDGEEGNASAFPLQVQELDLSAQERYARAFALPQVSWEPVWNLTAPARPGDPPQNYNFYPDDGGPTRIGTTGKKLVALAPLPLTQRLVQKMNDPAVKQGINWTLFALPFGMKAFAMLEKENGQVKTGAMLSFNQPEFSQELKGGLQLRFDGGQAPNQGERKLFRGATLQLDNVYNDTGASTGANTLGASVATIFNNEFMLSPTPSIRNRGVPLTRIDMAGYGASTTSHWLNDNAMIAQTSQARFDIFRGRTAHEVIQVRSILYPWGIKVVRTITIFRSSTAIMYRFDSGWQAESDGLFDFAYRVPIEDGQPNVPNVVEPRPNPYHIHPGTIKGLFNVREIVETTEVAPFLTTWNKTIWNNGDPKTLDNTYINLDYAEDVVKNSTDPKFKQAQVELQPVFFNADVEIKGVVEGAVNGRVPSKRILGFVQLSPAAQPLSPRLFRDLINSQFGAIGGPLDCTIALAETKQKMRLSRFEVASSVNAANDANSPVFVGTTRGSVILPKDGSWSLVQHTQGTGEVAGIPPAQAVPLIQEGAMGSQLITENVINESGQSVQVKRYTSVFPNNVAQAWRIANPPDLLRPLQADSINFGFLQNTDTQKALFRLPNFKKGVDELLSEVPDFADAYRLVNTKAVFPNVQDAIKMPLGSHKMKIIEEGYNLLNEALPDKLFEMALPATPLILVDQEPYLKIYIEYNKPSGGGGTTGGLLNFDIKSALADTGKRWQSKMEAVTMVVDLGPITRMMMVSGRFNTEKGIEPGFIEPEIRFNEEYLQPVIDLLTLLAQLTTGNYKDAISKGLKVAMSNTPDSWEYRLSAVKEIPVLRFPTPDPGPSTPLRLEAGIRVGCYFNQPFKLTTDIEQLTPSAGAFLEFYGRIAVMCASVGVASIYATGAVNLAIAADIKLGPTLKMTFSFGAEIVVGLPVAGNVSLLFMVGCDIFLSSTTVIAGGLLLFKGRAEILGGLVTIQIMIEAKGSIEKRIGSAENGSTSMLAQVTFAIDISIAWIINISFSESWQEQRQLA